MEHHIKANASKYKNIRYDRAQELEQKLDADFAELPAETEAADERDEDDGQRLPKEITRREVLPEKIRESKAVLEKKAREKEQQRQDPEDHDRGERSASIHRMQNRKIRTRSI